MHHHTMDGVFPNALKLCLSQNLVREPWFSGADTSEGQPLLLFRAIQKQTRSQFYKSHYSGPFLRDNKPSPIAVIAG